MASTSYVLQLCELGKSAGLDALGVASAEPFEAAKGILHTRKQQGLSGGMQFTFRNPDRSTTPESTLAEARTLIVGALAYQSASPPKQATATEIYGQVASYAQRDYYGQLRLGLDAIARQLQADGWQAKIVIDDNALMDREAAFRAGLGWYGKNTCLLIPRRGSQFVLGSVITDVPLPYSQPIDRSCGTCSLCQRACPTGALDTAGQLDARRCLAWLLQQGGIFPRQHRAALGNRFYGCDSCQTACPVGKSATGLRNKNQFEVTAAEGAISGGGATGESSTGEDTVLDRVKILSLLRSTDEELLRRYGRFYIAKRQPRYLRRNALVVLGNTGNPKSWATRTTLAAALRDTDPIVRAHAVWAARRMGLDNLALSAQYDCDARVREEARLPVEVRTSAK